ncbi:outer membrane protein [Klebsiella pneumoniae]|uniref:Outer membrane protein n=1 Tax=Klebsiella pneumoniae TaxID=573 RepID=A0A2X3BVS3_KLEPN|nr:outer membrane protein [Klebsiella pneumoniae]
MKRIIHTTVAALALTLASYAARADEINRQDAAGLMPSGHISAGNLSTLDEVTAALKARVEQAGASYFRITSLDGKNKFYGTAVIYR